MIVKHPYDPNIHHRRSIRLKGYDYAQPGHYFITICCHEFKCRFGHIQDGKMILNELGTIAYEEWLLLEKRFPNFKLDAFQIMPNHMHAILRLIAVPTLPENSRPSAIAEAGMEAASEGEMRIGGGDVAGASPVLDGAGASPVLDGAGASPVLDGAGASPARTGGEVVGAYKSLVERGCRKLFESRNERMGKLWHRNYYERIIRNEKEYQRVVKYIRDNPANWPKDRKK